MAPVSRSSISPFDLSRHRTGETQPISPALYACTMVIDKQEMEEQTPPLQCCRHRSRGTPSTTRRARKLIKKVIRLCVYECKNIKGIGRAMAKNATKSQGTLVSPTTIDGADSGWMMATFYLSSTIFQWMECSKRGDNVRYSQSASLGHKKLAGTLPSSSSLCRAGPRYSGEEWRP